MHVRALAAVLVLFAPVAAWAQSAPDAVPSPDTTSADTQHQDDGDGRRTIGRLPVNLFRATVGTVHDDTRSAALTSLGATGFALLLDDDFEDRLADPDNGFGLQLEDVGRPWMSSAVTFGLLVGSRFSESSGFRAVSYDLFNAQVVNWLYTTALKRTVRRERPDGEDQLSFPSGHASNAFALATVVAGHYGWRGGIPAYALAGAMAASRLQRNRHHLSDVVGGAAIGYLVGHTVVHVNSDPLEDAADATVTVIPVIGAGTRAVMVSVVF